MIPRKESQREREKGKDMELETIYGCIGVI